MRAQARRHRPRQPRRPAQSLDAAQGRLAPSRRGRRLEPLGVRRGRRRAGGRPHAAPAGRRPLPGASARSARWRAIAARRGKKLRVLWLDAHADFNTEAISPSGNMHGMPVACLCGHGPQALIGSSGAACRRSAPKWMRLHRHPQRRRRREAGVHELGLEVFDMRYIDEMGMRHTMERGAARRRRRHPPARELRRRLPRPDDRARRRHRRAGRPDLPRGAAVHGDDRRHRPRSPRST